MSDLLNFFIAWIFLELLLFYYFFLFGLSLGLCHCTFLGFGLGLCLYLRFGPAFWFYFKIKLRLYGRVRVAGYECEAKKCSSLGWSCSISEKRAFELMFLVCGLISQSVY